MLLHAQVICCYCNPHAQSVKRNSLKVSKYDWCTYDWMMVVTVFCVLFSSYWNTGTHRNSQELAGTRRDSQEFAGTRREHWNSQELAGTRRIFGTLEHWYSAVAWPPGLADGRRRWQSRVEAWYTWHRMVEWQSRRDRAVTGGGGGRGTSMGERGKLEK